MNTLRVLLSLLTIGSWSHVADILGKETGNAYFYLRNDVIVSTSISAFLLLIDNTGLLSSSSNFNKQNLYGRTFVFM